jgi:general secretion pathway protein H
MQPRRHHRGFTLIELMVVLGLLGLMFGVVFLRLDGMVPATRLRAGARELASHLEMSRNHAVVSGKTVVVQYDLASARYRAYMPYELATDGITVLGDGETSVFDWMDLPDEIEIQDVRIGDGDALDQGIVTVTFEPRGIATGHTVHLRKADTDRSYSVMVSPLMGYVDATEGYYEPEVLDEDDL